MTNKKIKRKSRVDSAEVIKVIHVDSVVGEGTESDPVRRITEYYTFEGALLARVDPCAGAQAINE